MAKGIHTCICFLLLPLAVLPYHQPDLRRDVVAVAITQVGVQEVGTNCGPEVREYLKYTRLGCGHAWCSAFVSWCFGKAGYEQPRSAWSPAVISQGIPKKKGPIMTGDIRPGMVIGLYYANLGRIGHTGIIERVDGSNLHTIEGNTNAAGSREGQGVYRKIRRLSQVHSIVSYE